jgi:outer membrane receptor protein involved in Fe transport
MIKFLKLVLFAAFLVAAITLSAQVPGAGRGQMGGQGMNLGHFYGKIIDAGTNKPVEAASIQLIQTKFDTATKKRKDVVVSGMLTTKKGEFSLENLSIMGSYKLKITAIGYKPIEQKVAFELNMSGAKNGDYSGLMNAVDKDLGNIKLQEDAQQLAGVTVTGSKPLLEMKIDRKVFNVEKNLTSVGGTAIDVMKNIPSVNVDIDGNVTMRNATPQIFVDGRPSTLTLEQIPADAISSVEIITNPSAKFDASGGGAGILNVILKKNRKAGYNGSVRASIDSRAKPSFGGDFNMKQGKINFFANAQIGFRKSKSEVSTNQSNFLSGDTTASLSQRNNPLNKGVFAFGRLGMDYFIDNRNTITIGGNIVRGQFKTNDLINIFRDTVVNAATTSNDNGYRKTYNEGNFRNYGTMLSFKHNFAKAGKELTADVNYNYSKNDNTGDYTTQYFNADGSAKTPVFAEGSAGGGVTKFFTAQTDYVNPITDKIKIEMGARAAFRDFSSFSSNFFKGTSIPALVNNYQFNDAVYAGYVTFSQQLKKLSYQLGLRAESSNYDGNLITSNQKFSTSYPLSLFPSAFFSYKLNDKQDMQLNYSRKINRPNFFQLIPYIDVSDPLNLSQGNPDLVPEFTNLIELAYQNQLNKNNSILATVYFRNTTDLITRYQYKGVAPNISDSVLINTYINANNSYNTGIELISKNKLAKWWDLTTNFNLYQSTLKAGAKVSDVDNSRVSFFAKMNNNFKLPKNYSIQFSGDYQAKTILPPGRGGGGGGFMGGGGFGQGQTGAQGYIKPNYGFDLAIKKEFLKNNTASLTLQISDIFRTKVYATHAESADFVQDNERRRDPQVVRLNFNWRFGKFDVSLFKRKNLKGEMENMQNMQSAGQ